MKKAAITGIVIGALAIGGIGGNFVVSQMLENRIRDSFANPPSGIQAQCDNVRVSLLQRTVSLSNLRLNGPEGEHSCRELVLRPSFSLMLAGSIPSLHSLLPTSGPLTLGDMTAQDVRLHSAPFKDAAPAEGTLKTLSISDAYLDAALFAELLQKKGKPTVQDLIEKAGASRIEATQLRLQAAESDPVTVESLALGDIVVGTKAGLVEVKKFEIIDTKQNAGVRGALLRLTDIAVPPRLARILLSNALTPNELEQVLTRTQQPLYRTMTLEDGTIFANHMTVEYRRLSHDWRSNTPLHSIVSIEQLDIPATGRLRIPGLKRLVINGTGEHMQQGDMASFDFDVFRDKVSLDVAGIGHFDMDMEHNINASRLSLEETNALSLLGAQIKKGSLRYEDKGGIARMLATVIPNKQALPQVDMLAAQIPAALPGETNRPLVEALHTMLITPGTLELRLRDGMGMTVLDLTDIENIGRKIEASAVPGKENVKDQILRVQAQ